MLEAVEIIMKLRLGFCDFLNPINCVCFVLEVNRV